MKSFKVHADFQPAGDQPQAIDELVAGLNSGLNHQVLLGVTGSGKTYTMAKVIEAVQRPALIISHNKTLAAQLAGEFKEFFPDNAVEYFVSYYDYYQPEAYVPHQDLFIEKDAAINDEIDRLRHFATQALLSRRDVVICASVSCIYGLGSPEDYAKLSLRLKVGETIDRDPFFRRLVDMQYLRNDTTLVRGSFRALGDTIEIYPPDAERIFRVDTFGDEIESIKALHPITRDPLEELDEHWVFPATHYVVVPEKMELILKTVEKELWQRLKFYEDQGRVLEYERLKSRTLSDIEMIRELGYCSGIENYARHFTGRPAGEPGSNLIEYFPKDFITILDESHQTVPQLGAMYKGDRSRKETLVEYGFRLPSALDNRPLEFEEFQKLTGQKIYVSATPGPFEKKMSERTVELVIRPTGLIDPEIVIRPVKGQVDDLIGEIRETVAKGERVLATTLTKRMAEDLTHYLQDLDIRVRYLHSDIDAIERIQIIRGLRLGDFDVLVGINLLREGLDMPEVSLVAILDADKEGFLRSDTSLIQTMGRAARNVDGRVILYADSVTGSMERAIAEAERRRAKQREHNEKHGITPRTIVKKVSSFGTGLTPPGKGDKKKNLNIRGHQVPLEEIPAIIEALRVDMFDAAEKLEFERAAAIRDEVRDLEEMMGAKVTGRRARKTTERRVKLNKRAKSVMKKKRGG